MPTKMTIARYKYLIDNCFCPKCGKLWEISPSGAVCINHGLVMGIDRRDLKDAIFADRLKKLPVAEFDERTFCWHVFGIGEQHTLFVEAAVVQIRAPQLYRPGRVIEARYSTDEYWFIGEFMELRRFMAAL